MTVSTAYTPEQYTGTGANTELAVNFVFIQSSHLVVTKTVTATGVQTVLSETTHYTVTGGSWGTGTVTPVDGATDFPGTVTWTIERDTSVDQQTDWVENDDFPAETHERAADKLTLIAQERDWFAQRGLKFPSGDSITLSAELPAKADRASTYLGFDADGEPIALSAPTDTSVTTTYTETLLDDPDAETARATLDAQQDVITAQGDLVVADATPKASALAVGSDGEVLRSDGTDPSWQPPDYRPNALINGNFSVWQRGTSFDSTTTPANNDDTYLMDRWILLSDGNDIVDVLREATVIPTGLLYSVKLDVETGSKKFGVLQVIEQKNCAHLIGGKASLSFKARTSSGVVENLRAAVLAWSGAADAVTSDVVSAWGAEGTNPTWAANWTAENTPANLALSNTFQTFKVQNVSIAANRKNVAVFIWVDDLDLIATDVFYLADVQLVPGESVGPAEIRSFQEEITLCQRYYTKTFPYTTAPAQNVGDDAGTLAGVGAPGTGEYEFNWGFKQTMFATPTIITFDPYQADANAYNVTDGSDTPLVAIIEGDNGSAFIGGGDASDSSDVMIIHATAEAEL